jgi:predicted DNA binding CopG/RHH family protein
MKKKIVYTDDPIQLGKRIKDFLPPPGQLVKRVQTVKVTLELTESSLAYFKRAAKREKVPYQRMIRGLIDAYASTFN